MPSALQIGWAESPAYFCAATETGRDLIDMLLREGVARALLEQIMKLKDIPKTALPGPEERTSVGVYVDDYVLGVVENDDWSLIRRVSRATLLHAIHSIFPPPEFSGHHVGGKDPISQKKLEKGDARFDTEKEISAFLINGAGRTVRLLEPKAESIADDITKLLRKCHVSLKRFRSWSFLVDFNMQPTLVQQPKACSHRP